MTIAPPFAQRVSLRSELGPAVCQARLETAFHKASEDRGLIRGRIDAQLVIATFVARTETGWGPAFHSMTQSFHGRIEADGLGSRISGWVGAAWRFWIVVGLVLYLPAAVGLAGLTTGIGDVLDGRPDWPTLLVGLVFPAVFIGFVAVLLRMMWNLASRDRVLLLEALQRAVEATQPE
jgi:hypothetical protein